MPPADGPQDGQRADEQVADERAAGVQAAIPVELWAEWPLQAEFKRQIVLSRPGGRVDRVTYGNVCDMAISALPGRPQQWLAVCLVEPYLQSDEQLRNLGHFLDQVVIGHKVGRCTVVTTREASDSEVTGAFVTSAATRLAEQGCVLRFVYEPIQLVHQRLMVIYTDVGAVAWHGEWGLHMYDRVHHRVPSTLRPCRRTTVDFFLVRDVPAVEEDMPAVHGGRLSLRYLRRKLYETALLERRLAAGGPLTTAQQRALARRPVWLEMRASLRLDGRLDAGGADAAVGTWRCPNPLCSRINPEWCERCPASGHCAATGWRLRCGCPRPDPDVRPSEVARGYLRRVHWAAHVLQRWCLRLRRPRIQRLWQQVWEARRLQRLACRRANDAEQQRDAMSTDLRDLLDLPRFAATAGHDPICMECGTVIDGMVVCLRGGFIHFGCRAAAGSGRAQATQTTGFDELDAAAAVGVPDD